MLSTPSLQDSTGLCSCFLASWPTFLPEPRQAVSTRLRTPFPLTSSCCDSSPHSLSRSWPTLETHPDIKKSSSILGSSFPRGRGSFHCFWAPFAPTLIFLPHCDWFLSNSQSSASVGSVCNESTNFGLKIFSKTDCVCTEQVPTFSLVIIP
jgi:hypothetical protein